MSYLVVNLNNGSEFVFDLVDSKLTLGRNAKNDIVIENNYISSFHAELIPKEDQSFELVDLKSANGTFVNGDRIDKKILAHGDVLRFGQLNAKFVAKKPRAKKDKGMTGLVTTFVPSLQEKAIRSTLVSSVELLVDANGVTIPLPPPTAPLRPISIAPILAPVEIQVDTQSLVHVASPRASTINPKSRIPSAMQNGQAVPLRPGKPVGRASFPPSKQSPGSKPQSPSSKPQPPRKEDKSIKLPPAFIPPPPEPVVPVSTKPGKPPKAGPPKRIGPPTGRPMISAAGAQMIPQGGPPISQNLRPVARPPGSQLPPPTQNLAPPIAQPVQRKQPARQMGGPAQIRVIPPSRPATQKPKAPSAGYRPPAARGLVPMGYGAPPANVTLVLNSPMMPGMQMMPGMMPNMQMMMPGMMPSMYGMPMMPGMMPPVAPLNNNEEMLKQQQQLLAQQRDAFRAEMAGAESRLSTVRAEILTLEGEKDKLTSETPSSPVNANTNMVDLIASIEIIKNEIAVGLASDNDEETFLIYINDIIKRLDLVDILIQRYSSPDRDREIEEKLKRLHASFLTILTNYHVSAFIIPPGTEIVALMNNGITVIEESPGPNAPKITECIHPGYVRVSKDGKQHIIRKLEVKSSRSI